ncbi:hypothetical protein HPB48_015282 [Haemaphysalis longicornis]|uniref:Uncharacterized protein n=1 Tax=Haemaphysalis longicornis TaxID=44386 RepID=A0A9J6H6X5_HAELO|nr:hypothetical protein HPB48_015282 [Haemaphysalis longicornis]
MPLGMFDAKANEAIQKNFKPSQDIPKKQNAMVLRLLKNRNLEQLPKAVTEAKKSDLEVFFTGKTHKPKCPLRAIISERFLAKRGQHLSSAHCHQTYPAGPFLGA